MFENIINFFKRIGKKEQLEASSKDTAKERLHLVLMQDRANVSADFLDMMRQEIIEVIKKYIDVDENDIDVRLTNRTNEDGTTGAPALYANIPITGIKEEIKKETSVKEPEKESEKEQEGKQEEKQENIKSEEKEPENTEKKEEIPQDSTEKENTDSNTKEEKTINTVVNNKENINSKGKSKKSKNPKAKKETSKVTVEKSNQ